MPKEKRSFFERLTGTMRMDEEAADAVPTRKPGRVGPIGSVTGAEVSSWMDTETEDEGELTIDVYQTPEMIVVKSMIAGVRPEDLDVTIGRDMISIRGKREEERIANENDYFVRELYWGSFSRTIQLPEEVDVDEAEAIEKHGLLILKLPKLDKKRQSKIKVKTV